MTRSLQRAAVLLLTLTAASAHAQEPAPCAALTPKVQPCAAPAEVSSDAPPLATIDGAPITLADLDEATRKTIVGLPAAEDEARRKAMREDADDALLAREAARRGVTIGRLLETEVIAKTEPPSDADVAAEIAAHPEKYKRGKDDAGRAAANLLNRRRHAREEQFLAGIESTAVATPPASLHVETAVADERIRVLEAQKSAVDQAIHDRLLRAAAAKEGVTPEELTSREVTAKLRPATDAELKAEWAKYKKIFGDDFERARDAVRKSVESDRKAAAEKAFDDRLRAGHAIRVLFDVPQRPAQNVLAESAPSAGPRDATVTLVEFGDFECPPCGYMAGVVDEALRPYATRVRYVFRQYPMTFHPFARKAAEAALAAHAQGRFFPYAHVLFANQDALDVASLKKYAAEIGLDRKRFDADLDSGRYAAAILEDQRSADRAGFFGTPTFFLNGVRLGGDAYSLEGMRAAIDRALTAAAPERSAPR